MITITQEATKKNKRETDNEANDKTQVSYYPKNYRNNDHFYFIVIIVVNQYYSC